MLNEQMTTGGPGESDAVPVLSGEKYLGIPVSMLTGDDLWQYLGEPHPFLADSVKVEAVPVPLPVPAE